MPTTISGSTGINQTTFTATTLNSSSGAINATIGATTPNTGAFTTLSATGNTTIGINTGNPVVAINGTGAGNGGGYIAFQKLGVAKGYVGMSSAINGGGSTSDDLLLLNATGTSAAAVTSTGVSVIGTLSSTGYGTFKGLRIGTDGTNDIFQSTGDLYYSVTTGFAHKWGNSTVGTQATLDASGNLGLGVTPSAWFASNSYKAIDFGYGNIASQSGAGGAMEWSQGVYRNAAGTYVYKNAIAATMMQQNAGATYWITYTGNLGAGNTPTAASTAMTLDASGNLLVGSIAAAGTSGGGIAALGLNSQITYRASGATAGKFRFTAADTSNAFLVYNNSNVGMYMSDGATVWTANSDERLKTDLIPITDALTKVASLRTVTGRYKTDEVGVSRSFLIAQDVIKVLPEAVSTHKLPNDDTEYLGVGYSDLIPLALAAIKEQQAQIQSLRTEFNTYKELHP